MRKAGGSSEERCQDVPLNSAAQKLLFLSSEVSPGQSISWKAEEDGQAFLTELFVSSFGTGSCKDLLPKPKTPI